MNKHVTIPYTPRKYQKILHDNLKRFNVVVCHRRFGKTVFAVIQILVQALMCKHQRPQYAYIAPTYKQAKTIAWDYFIEFSRAIPGIKVNQSELKITLPNGAKIQLFGSENAERLRGMYFDGVICDEYGDMIPEVYTKIILPAISDRKGFIIFLGTPKGKNHFYDILKAGQTKPDWYVQIFRASDTGIIDEAELATMRANMTDEEYAQEFECSFTSSILGAYFTKQMLNMRNEGRVCAVPYKPDLKVTTLWDIGMSDATVVHFLQVDLKRHEFNIIDTYYDKTGGGLHEAAKAVLNRPYIYGRHVAPHDIRARDWSGNGATRFSIARELGIKFDVAPKKEINDTIDVLRMKLFPTLRIDEGKCDLLVEALENYRRVYDPLLKVFREKPLHDWSSDLVDPLRTYTGIMSRDLSAEKLQDLPKVANSYNPLTFRRGQQMTTQDAFAKRNNFRNPVKFGR